MLALATETAQTIAWDTREWTRLKKMQTFVGDGVLDVDNSIIGTEAFDLPADFRRMLLTARRSTARILDSRCGSFPTLISG